MSTVENLNKIFLEFCDDLTNVVPEFSKALENAKKRIEEKPDTKYYLEYFFLILFKLLNGQIKHSVISL